MIDGKYELPTLEVKTEKADVLIEPSNNLDVFQ